MIKILSYAIFFITTYIINIEYLLILKENKFIIHVLLYFYFIFRYLQYKLRNSNIISYNQFRVCKIEISVSLLIFLFFIDYLVLSIVISINILV